MFESWILNHSQDAAETETEVAEKSSWDQANRGEKLGLVWRNRKKISQIINDYLCLPFFLLIILWLYISTTMCKVNIMIKKRKCEVISSKFGQISLYSYCIVYLDYYVK